ncbi:tagatose 1,6-diphosphate aldolase [Kribbella aluminosa]|uniref:Tagatose 1,6-diphosphate aldolase n=1 Tax=Kribbella aluminosa TaxID=416017 RepID=A0ABS4UJ42_9ACTN|nr:hypothetical protein [Kribbella aluminosa]MBP2351677.1 tagatose 1,6-diphosphate aldolase [Kribbella aluminosa]
MTFVIQDAGKLRSLQRVLSGNGFLEICALDHQRVLKTMLSEDPDAVAFRDIVALKDRVLRAVEPSVSGVLTDVRYGGPILVASGAMTSSTGYIVEIGDEGYDIPPGPRRSRLRAGWSMEKLKLIGADVAKFLWFFRPDADAEVADHQRGVLAQLVEQSARYSLPMVVEPIWYPLIGEDTSSAPWRERRVQGIVESAIEADRLGADLLKLEFPGYLGDERGAERSHEACAEVTANTRVPWVLLSGGVGFEDFDEQLRIGCSAGASGYMAGRSVWQEVAVTRDDDERDRLIGQLRSRLERLNATTSANGRAVELAIDLDAAVERFPEFWYEGWQNHEQGSAEKLSAGAA